MITKKTYVPGKPRNKKLTNVTGGSATVGKTEFSQVAGESHTHPNKGVLDQITEAMLESMANAISELIKVDDETELTDENVMSSLRVIAEILSNNEELKNIFLSKVGEDEAAELITFLKGLVSHGLSKLAELQVDGNSLFNGLVKFAGDMISGDFLDGLAGFGGKINNGHATLRSLTVWEWFRAVEFVFNRVDIISGDLWLAPGKGKIRSVDTVQKVVELELEDGEIGAIDADDICMGIFHSINLDDNSTVNYDDSKGNRRYAGYYTSYFRIIQVLDQRKTKFRYELRNLSSSYPEQFHPCPQMKFTSYGNFTNPDRQNSTYFSRDYLRFLKGVRTWEFSLSNIGAQLGNMDNLNVFGLNTTGYSLYANNVYFTGIIYQISQLIQEELDKQQVGGKNLLREYDIRFNFKYWGGTGEFIEVDLDALQNQPILSVSPTEVAWVYPEHYSELYVTSNTNWNIN